MSMNWVNALDACAAGGVLDYDASADLLDAPSRFAGHPDLESIPPLLPEGVKIKQQPVRDRYDNSGNLIENPKWKKGLFVGVILASIAALTIGIMTRKGKIKTPAGIKNFGAKVWNVIKKPFTFIGKLFKKKPSAPTP